MLSLAFNPKGTLQRPDCALQSKDVTISALSVEPEHVALLDQIRAEWDKAEENIKQSEQIAGELSLPAINELRYAGRRLVDAWAALARGDIEDFRAKLADAKFDCYRARHDAVDAITSKVAKDIDLTVTTFTLTVVVKAYPNYTNLISHLLDIQEKIRNSRGDRENREAIYTAIESSDIAGLAAEHRRFRLAEPAMITLADEGKESRFYEKGGFWVAMFFGVVALIEGFLLWYFPRA